MQKRSCLWRTFDSEHVNIDYWLVSQIADQNLDLCPLRKRKVQKLTDSNIEKCIIHSRRLQAKYTQKTLQTAIKNNIFKVKQLYNSLNNIVYFSKIMKRVEVPEERLFWDINAKFCKN